MAPCWLYYGLWASWPVCIFSGLNLYIISLSLFLSAKKQKQKQKLIQFNQKKKKHHQETEQRALQSYTITNKPPQNNNPRSINHKDTTESQLPTLGEFQNQKRERSKIYSFKQGPTTNKEQLNQGHGEEQNQNKVKGTQR